MLLPLIFIFIKIIIVIFIMLVDKHARTFFFIVIDVDSHLATSKCCHVRVWNSVIYLKGEPCPFHAFSIKEIPIDMNKIMKYLHFIFDYRFPKRINNIFYNYFSTSLYMTPLEDSLRITVTL